VGRGQQWLKQGKGIEVDIATQMTFPDSDPDRTRILEPLRHGHGHGGGVLVVIHRLSLSLSCPHMYTHLALTVVLRPPTT